MNLRNRDYYNIYTSV